VEKTLFKPISYEFYGVGPFVRVLGKADVWK